MASALGSLRRLVLAPSLAEVSMRGRGFALDDTAATRKLEAVPQAVVCGFEWGIDARGLWEVQRRLDLVDAEQRGFACEGVTMAFTVLDAMGRSRRTSELLLGAGQQHIFLAYIGVGFAMARLPRVLWKKVWNKTLPQLVGTRYHAMHWLAVDGYGFDLAYFSTQRWVDRQEVPAPYPWDGCPGYFPRAVDQGIGRALWFIHGGQVPQVASAVGRFAEHRHADLWSGVGLAAVFAGGGDPAELGTLRKASGDHHAHLAQGAVFAAKARAWSGFVPDHTAVTLAELTDLTVAQADVLADVGAEDAHAAAEAGSGERTGAGGRTPPYELWRAKVRDHLGWPRHGDNPPPSRTPAILANAVAAPRPHMNRSSPSNHAGIDATEIPELASRQRHSGVPHSSPNAYHRPAAQGDAELEPPWKYF